MKELLDEYSNFLNILMKKRLPTLFSINLHNGIILNLEILDGYNSKWEKKYTLPKDEMEEARKANGERIMRINKQCFIDIMSTFEYDMKQFLLHTTNEKLKQIQLKLKSGKFLQFSEIIKDFKKSGLISEEDYEIVIGITKIRNIIVHNDTRPSNLEVVVSLRNLFHTYEIGKQLNATLDVFLKLIIKLNNFHEKWYYSQKVIYAKFVPEQPSTINYIHFK